MAIKVICDRCESENVPANAYPLSLRDYNADLCMSCAAEVQDFIEKGSNE